MGFALSSDPKTLVVQTGDRCGVVAFDALAIGQPVGVLGLNLSNRRRNRIHGCISALGDSSISITVVQSYGNCPNYISIREVSDWAPSSYLPGALEQAVEAFVEYYNHTRDHESLSNVTPADVYFGRHHDILSERRKTKENTLKLRRLINHERAA